MAILGAACTATKRRTGENVVIVIPADPASTAGAAERRRASTRPSQATLHRSRRPAGAMLEHSWRSGAGNRLMAKGYAAPLLSVLR
jgi:hypothetical protein